MELKELYQLAENRDIRVEHFHLEANKALTAEYIPGSFAIALDDKKIENKTEEKMCIAHELGHCESGAFYMAQSPFETIGRCEARVFRWELDKMLPYEKLEKAFKKGYTESWELAEYFDLPEDFVRKAVKHYNSTE